MFLSDNFLFLSTFFSVRLDVLLSVFLSLCLFFTWFPCRYCRRWPVASVDRNRIRISGFSETENAERQTRTDQEYQQQCRGPLKTKTKLNLGVSTFWEMWSFSFCCFLWVGFSILGWKEHLYVKKNKFWIDFGEKSDLFENHEIYHKESKIRLGLGCWTKKFLNKLVYCLFKSLKFATCFCIQIYGIFWTIFCRYFSDAVSVWQ